MGTHKANRKCEIDGCKGKHVAKGLCAKHYMRVKKFGDPYHGDTVDEPELKELPEDDQKLSRNISQLSAFVGVDKRIISSKISGLPPTGKRNGRDVYNVPSVMRILFGGMPSTPDDPYPGMKPTDRRAMVAYEIDWIELMHKRKEYLNANEVHEFLAERFKEMDLRLATMPDEIERQAGLSPEQLSVVDRVINDIRPLLVYNYEG